jgi:N6-L-threonylcarbamoyladenine synthase
MSDSRTVFSFSGLKTAVRTVVEALPRPLDDQTIADVCLEAQEAIVDVLCHRLFQAARRKHARAVYLAGGVAANGRLRERIADEAGRRGLHFLPPERVYCTDNAAMIAYAGALRLQAGQHDDATVAVRPRWDMATLATVD